MSIANNNPIYKYPTSLLIGKICIIIIIIIDYNNNNVLDLIKINQAILL